MISENKIASNRNNSLKSTGPKTERGKNKSKRNPLKHGIFSKELYISEQDQLEYDHLRSQLLSEFKPATPARMIAAERIVGSAWRHKLATRMETKYIRRSIEVDESEAISQPPTQTVTDWYAANPRAATTAINLLHSIIEDVRKTGSVHPDIQAQLVQAFGQQFNDDLQSWHPSDMTCLMVVENMQRKHKILKEYYPSDEFNLPKCDGTVVVRDPNLQAEMMAKILEQKREHLQEMLHIIKDRNQNTRLTATSGNSDLALRYQSSTFKELRNAIEFFVQLKKIGL
jgi:hypothetical protein